MNKAEEYQERLDQVECTYDARPEDIIDSLRLLVEDMIETIKYLEDFIEKNA